MSQRPIQNQFVRFCVVGAVAFVVNAAVVQALVSGAGVSPYLAGAISYLAAATTAWALNRRYTFGAGALPLHREWLAYLAANLTGAVVYYAVYGVLISLSQAIYDWPWIGVAAGSVAGLAVNFAASKWYVFKPRSE